MTTERMTQERLTWFRLRRREVEAMGLRVDPLVVELHDEVERARRVEQEQAEEIRHLKEMLRLANDKMAEQVRQARWEVAEEALGLWVNSRQNIDTRLLLERISDANAPKD